MKLGLEGKKAVVTGGGGAICGAISSSLAAEGANVAVWDISAEAAHATAARINDQVPGAAVAIHCDVTSGESIETACRETLHRFGTIDILVNGAGGSRRETTTSPELEFFDLSQDEMESTIRLNYMSAVLVAQAVGREFARRKSGVIVNISSVAGISPVTRAVSYSNGKAAANSFTRWLAVHMARSYDPAIRVNAIAPGFVLTGQNRFLLVDEKQRLTERGDTILREVPMKRFGDPEEISGAVLWLVSEQASFVTGAVIPVDGGFTAFGGV